MKKAFNRIRKEIKAQTTRSAWSKGVEAYALDLLDSLEEQVEDGYFDFELIKKGNYHLICKAFLNGAACWRDFSWGGCSLIYDYDIAKRLCNKSELKRTKNGFRKPNKREDWLDVQTRALFQASKIVCIAIGEVYKGV